MLPLSRFLGATAITLNMAIAAVMLLTWQMHRPIPDLAEAARAYRQGGGLRQVAARGPSELRELIGDFNDTVGELAEFERERTEMLASIAHRLGTPLIRIQVRTDLLDSKRDRIALLRDTESMGRVISRFLCFAGVTAGSVDETCVDLHCHLNDTNVLGGRADAVGALVKLDLQTGPGFTLPSVNIDRTLLNLIEYAMAYGEPPWRSLQPCTMANTCSPCATTGRVFQMPFSIGFGAHSFCSTPHAAGRGSVVTRRFPTRQPLASDK